MKKILFLLISLSFLALFSCQEEETVLNTENPTEGQSKYELSAQQAEKILGDFIQRQGVVSIATRSKQVSITGYNKKVYSTLKTRSGDNPEGIAFYNFDLKSGNDKGFAIVCADRRLPQVIAYAHGSLEEIPNCGNTFLSNYVENLPEAVAILIQNRTSLPDFNHRYVGGFPYEDISDVAHSWDTDSTQERVVFLHEAITWEQTAPYNYLMPKNASGQHYPVGCSNIACANIMSYYRYPDTYEWDSLTQFRVIIEGYQSDKIVMEAAQLCKDIFTANNSTPTDDGTGTNPNDVIKGLKSFGYESSSLMDYSLDSIKVSLEKFHPVYMRGQDPDKTTGHAFVVRGYWDIIPKNPSGDLDPSTCIGINWGWMGGFGDGFYLVEYAGFNLAHLGLYPLLFTNDGPKYSTDTYSDKVKLITHIRPKGK